MGVGWGGCGTDLLRSLICEGGGVKGGQGRKEAGVPGEKKEKTELCPRVKTGGAPEN